MAKSKDIKIYTYHGHYLKIKANTKGGVFKHGTKVWTKIFDWLYLIGLVVYKSLKFITNGIVEICFYIGNGILESGSETKNLIKKDIRATKHAAIKRLKLLGQRQFSYSLLVFIVVAGVALAGIGSLKLIAKALNVKDNVLKTASLGNNYLDQAKQALSSQNFDQADNRFSLAYQTFQRGQQQLESSGQALNVLLNLLPQKQAAAQLLQAAGLVSSAGQELTSLQNELKLLNIGPQGITASSESTQEILSSVSNSLGKISSDIKTANNLVGKIDLGSLPQDKRGQFSDLSTKLQVAQIALDDFNQVFSVMKNLLSGQKSVLLVFENNNELRAGGGFMGSYGDLKISDGKIRKITVSSIYDLDGQLTDVVQPPHPILNVNYRWFLRDSNWFADFPQTAGKITKFYELEGGETPDVIIGMTPNLIVNLLKITGPITLPRYDVTLDSDNFVEKTQALTSTTEDQPTNSPKQLLADFVPALLQKLSSSNKEQWPLIIQSLQGNLNNKQIVMYSRDARIQSELQNFHWAGQILPSDRDYFNVVSSNLGGTKTDLYIDQKIKLTTNIAVDGTITNQVEITRTNKMPGNLPDTDNDSYIRILAPLGSKLESVLGFDYKNLSYPENTNYQTDQDVYDWEKNSVTDNLSGTTIGQESGKTFFGNWLKVKGGESRTIKLSYQLPFKIGAIDRYSLLLQKQIGSTDSAFDWTMNFPGRSIAWKNFDTDQLHTSDLNSAIILNKDYLLGAVLQKR